MKNATFILILITISIVFSCTSKRNNTLTKKPESDTDIIAKKIMAYINTNANDPKSYEPISTILIDSISYKTFFKNQVDKDRLFDSSEKGLPKEFTTDRSKEIARYLKSIDSLAKSSNPNSIKSLIFYHTCRLKNGFGGLVKSTFRVKTDTELNIVDIQEIK